MAIVPRSAQRGRLEFDRRWRLAADGLSYRADDSFAYGGSIVAHESDRSDWFGLNPLIDPLAVLRDTRFE
jgi:hypothetical protein